MFQSTMAEALGEIEELRELEDRAKKLRDKGDHLNALKCMERVLVMSQDAYGYKRCCPMLKEVG